MKDFLEAGAKEALTPSDVIAECDITFRYIFLVVCPVTVVESPDPHKVNTIRYGTELQRHVYNQESVLFTVDMLFSYRELFFTSHFPSPPSNISHVCRSELQLQEYATGIVFPSLVKM